MIRIFSTDNDNTTNLVIDWLVYFGESFYRINDSEYDINNSFIIEINNYYRNNIMESKDTNWLRKWNNLIKLNVFFEKNYYPLFKLEKPPSLKVVMSL